MQGTLDLLILKILALQPLHGWAIGEHIKQMSKDVLQVGPGSLYPALHKLEQGAGLTRITHRVASRSGFRQAREFENALADILVKASLTRAARSYVHVSSPGCRWLRTCSLP